MNLLENELVRKYFGNGISEPTDIIVNAMDRMAMADGIISAMQEPIRKGERYLAVMTSGEVKESLYDTGDAESIVGVPMHGHYLRLPDRFQPKKECDHSWVLHCETCGRDKPPQCNCSRAYWQGHAATCPVSNPQAGQSADMENCQCTASSVAHIQPKPDAVEDKIRQMVAWMQLKGISADYWEFTLRELVALARKA